MGPDEGGPGCSLAVPWQCIKLLRQAASERHHWAARAALRSGGAEARHAPPSGIHGLRYPRQSRTLSRLALTWGASVRSTFDSSCTPAATQVGTKAREIRSEQPSLTLRMLSPNQPGVTAALQAGKSSSTVQVVQQQAAFSAEAHCRRPPPPQPCARAPGSRAPRTRRQSSRAGSTCRRRATEGTRSTGLPVSGGGGGCVCATGKSRANAQSPRMLRNK